MGDEGGMDPCECIWGHELAMRRLINLLRNSQTYCTDTECFDEGTSFRGQNGPDSVLLMTVFFMVAMFLMYFRPRAQRIPDSPSKPSFNGNGNGAPPTPPTST